MLSRELTKQINVKKRIRNAIIAKKQTVADQFEASVANICEGVLDLSDLETRRLLNQLTLSDMILERLNRELVLLAKEFEAAKSDEISEIEREKIIAENEAELAEENRRRAEGDFAYSERGTIATPTKIFQVLE